MQTIPIRIDDLCALKLSILIDRIHDQTANSRFQNTYATVIEAISKRPVINRDAAKKKLKALVLNGMILGSLDMFLPKAPEPHSQFFRGSVGRLLNLQISGIVAVIYSAPSPTANEHLRNMGQWRDNFCTTNARGGAPSRL